MARKTVMNDLTSPERIKKIEPENLRLISDFTDYLKSVQRSSSTINVYINDLQIAFVWCAEKIGNKKFINWSKRDVMSFQNWLINENHNSPARVRRIKATLSSLANFIETVLDDEYPNFRNIILKIPNPNNQPVREKTVLTNTQLNGLLDYLVDRKEFDKACMLALAMNNGRRKSELPRMKTEYFTEDNVICQGALYRTPETITTKGKGVNGKQLIVYTLKKDFQPYLDMWLEYRKNNGITSQWLIPKKEHLIYTDKQVPVSTMDSWAETFSNYLGVPFYWHSLRHYFTTKLAEANIPDSVIQDIIGWDSADMCRIYNDTNAEAKFEKYFGEDGIKEIQKGNLKDL